MTETCYYCGEPATHVRENRLDYIYFDHIGEEQANEPPGSGIRLHAASCDDHDNALSEALMDRFGSAGGWSLKPPHSEVCPGELEMGETESFGKGMFGHGYRCPLCGFQTMTSKPPHDPEDPVYQETAATLARVLGEPV